MNSPKSPPTFNLKAVVLETGLKPHTLRAWEQRYGLPKPGRTKGNQRVYTQNDIDTVKWLMARLEEGMTISRAVELWYKLKKRGEDPLSAAAYQISEIPQDSDGEGALAGFRQSWVEKCLNFDKVAAEHILAQAFAIYPVRMVCTEILQKGLSQIGELWFENKVTIPQEHFASALVVERINALMAAAPAPNRVGRILVACPKHEEHTISLLLLTLLLRYQGWEVVYLGANIPVTQLESTVETVKPDLVALAAQRLETAAFLADAAQLLNDRGINVAFGGSIFNLNPSLKDKVCGHYLGNSIDDAVGVISQIMTFNPPAAKNERASKAHERAIALYHIKRSLIELDTTMALENSDYPVQFLSKTHARLAQDILAALSLGDLNLINAEIELARDLIIHRNIPLKWQLAYMNSYYQAARKHLSKDGLLIIEWLDTARSLFQDNASAQA